MGKIDKLFDKFLETPTRSDLTYKELETLLKKIGFTKFEGNGSRVKFLKNNIPIMIHKPHPGNILKRYVIKQLQEILKGLK
jgi:predicted RNA binding protein YcfA (HicA-like mRNA interferase family)